MKRTCLVFLLIVWPGVVFSADVPPHAHLKVFAAGWECDEGFYQQEGMCLPVVVPEHGRLNILRNGWECESGYARSGDLCRIMRIPDHAQLDPFGKGWNCLPGFYQEGDQCQPVPVPPHATLDDLGRDWVCDHGFKKQEEFCIEMSEPEKLVEEKHILASKSSLQVNGPEGTSCHAGYNKCTSVCYQPVYDQLTGRPLKKTDFIARCSQACSEAEARCGNEEAKGQCILFDRICAERCPSTVHDLAAGRYLADTNAQSLCQQACRYGMAACDYHARKFPVNSQPSF